MRYPIATGLVCICIGPFAATVQASAADALLISCTFLGSGATDVGKVETNPAVLVERLADESNASTTQSAYLTLCRTLRNGSPETVKAIQDALCQQLAAATDTMVVRRVCLVLKNAPCDTAVLMVVDRLQAATSPRMRASACQALCDLVSRRMPGDPKIAELALSRLVAIARDREAPLPLLQGAMLAISAFGPTGFDALMKLHDDPNAPKHVSDIFYTALSDTGDPRALPVLRGAAVDFAMPQGLRIQAANAIGRLFYLAQRNGQAIDWTERARCWEALYQYLADDTPDQLFGVALKSLAEVAPVQQDAGVVQTIHAALTSASDVRREAALQVLYRTGSPVQGVTLNLVRFCAKSSDSESVRSTAEAVLTQVEPDNDFDAAQSP